MNKNVFVLALLKCSDIGPAKLLKYIIKNNYLLNKCIENITDIVTREEYELCAVKADLEIKKNEVQGIKAITIFDKSFPSKLYTITDPIIFLYYLGDITLLNKKSIGIIGTRQPSLESITRTKIISQKIIENGYVIVGGLALGIDTIGHKLAVKLQGKTIAVLPSGINNIQPVSNKILADEIVNSGGLLVSEYSVGTTLSKYNYAKRDRIQAALSNMIIVPEAKEDSGTMITVKKALKEGKKVYQLSTNLNNKIKATFNLDDDYINLFTSIIEKDEIEEKNKKQKLDNMVVSENKQISLF